MKNREVYNPKYRVDHSVGGLSVRFRWLQKIPKDVRECVYKLNDNIPITLDEAKQLWMYRVIITDHMYCLLHDLIESEDADFIAKYKEG